MTTSKKNGETVAEGVAHLSIKKKSHHDEHLSEEEQAKVDMLRNNLGDLSGRSRHYCTDACLERYLRARSWNVKKAEKMVKETLKWRLTMKPENIRWEDIAKEAETGKVYRANFVDNFGRSILILRPARQNTKDHLGQIRQLVYCMENAVLNSSPEQEQMVWLIDFDGWSMSNAVPLSSARETANILQNHYPERLGIAILCNPPRIFETFWAFVKPFLDPKTYKKVRFVYTKDGESMKLMEEMFDMEKLGGAFGGKATTDFDFDEFGKLMREDDVKMMEYWSQAD